MDQEGYKSARQWALKALGRRMHTACEIRAALAKRGYADETTASVIEDISRLGYINDLEFARAWVLSRSTHQLHGRLRLSRDLRLKGVADEVIEAVFRESLKDEDELAIAKMAVDKKRRTMRATGAKGRDSLYRHLRSKGFTARTISMAMAGMTFEEDAT